MDGDRAWDRRCPLQPKRCLGRIEFLTSDDYEASLGWYRHFFSQTEMATRSSAQ